MGNTIPSTRFALRSRGNLVMVLSAMASLVSAQLAYLPPRDAVHGWLLQRTPSNPSTNRLHFAVDARGETNLQPLLTNASPPFRASQAYFHTFRLYQISFEVKPWRFSYSYGEVDLYQGNNGAAQFYREAQRGFLHPDTTYPVQATLNRTAVNTLSVARLWETPTIQLTLAAHWLTLRRVQYGTLQGEKQGDWFSGVLTLYTTRGIAADEIDGQGFALDVGLLLQPNRRWRIGMKAENLLNYLRIGTLQQIEARVLVNHPKPDADGFLHAPPTLEGRTHTRMLRTHAAVYYQGMITYQPSSTSWTLIFTRDFGWRTGIAVAYAGPIEWWCIFWLDRPEWRFGFRSAGWELGIGFDQPNGSLAKRLSARIQWSLHLE